MNSLNFSTNTGRISSWTLIKLQWIIRDLQLPNWQAFTALSLIDNHFEYPNSHALKVCFGSTWMQRSRSPLLREAFLACQIWFRCVSLSSSKAPTTSHYHYSWNYLFPDTILSPSLQVWNYMKIQSWKHQVATINSKLKLIIILYVLSIYKKSGGWRYKCNRLSCSLQR